MEEKNNNDSSSHMSIFDESINDEENVNNENNNNNLVDEKEDEKILKFHEKFLAKKRKPLSEEEKKKRIEKRIERYCKTNDDLLQLFEKITNHEITRNNINHMMSLVAKDLSDSKKISNRKALIFNKKKEIFQRLLNLTFEEYQLFWYKLTDGKTKKGNAQLIKSTNISKAKEILKSLEDKKNENENEINKYDVEGEKKDDLINKNSKNNKTIKEIIEAADLRDNEIEKLNEEMLGSDNDISNSDESLSSSSSDSDEDIDNNSKSINIKNIDNNEEKKEKERKEKEEKERKEKEEKEKKEKEEKENKEKLLKKIMEEKDEIDIFN